MDTRPENGPFTLYSSWLIAQWTTLAVQDTTCASSSSRCAGTNAGGTPSRCVWWFCQILKTSCARLVFIPPCLLPPLNNIRYQILFCGGYILDSAPYPEAFGRLFHEHSVGLYNAIIKIERDY